MEGTGRVRSIEYDRGYKKAIIDLISVINKPGAPLERKLCNPVYLAQFLFFIYTHVHDFMESPELFEMHYRFEGKKLLMWKPKQSR